MKTSAFNFDFDPAALGAAVSSTPTVDFKTNLEGALWWFDFGYRVIPMVPGQKRPVLPYSPWLDELSVDAIRQHWAKHPDHEVGAVLDGTQVVLDADTEQADQALRDLEQRFGITPSLIVKTRRGHHHHYRVAEGAFAKADSHDTMEYPQRIDVRADRNSAVLTPSKDKSVLRLEARHRDDLTTVGQDFIDSVFQHNSRPAPRPFVGVPDDRPAIAADISTVSELVGHIDANCGYQDWLNVLMAIYHETGGSDAGLDLADTWSSKGRSYQGRAEIELKWRSFSGGVSHPITIATLVARAKEAGANVASIMREEFRPCATVVVKAPTFPVETIAPGKVSPLRRYSLIGQSEHYEAMAQATTPLLGDLCLRGEATVWYAKHNTGKTLLVLHLALEAVAAGRINGNDLYYINADDSSSGLAEKMGLLDAIGSHTLVPGQGGFKAANLEALLEQAVRDDTARGTVVVIDTLKKFVDLMSKAQASTFANVCRQFVSAGGSLLGLAHINKKRADNGRAVHAGTTDILDDFDAGYLIDELTEVGNPGERLVEFTRLKGRGGGVASQVFAYAAEDRVSYAERLASVRSVDGADIASIKAVAEQRSDAEVVAAIEVCIREGAYAKIALAKEVSARLDISRREAIRMIEKYTGKDPATSKWYYQRKDRGAMIYALHASLAEVSPTAA
jgi:archaellum biogenesis ATPase FlaH